MPPGEIPVWLRLDGRLRGASPHGAAASAALRNVVDPRTGKGCGEAHGKMRRLLGDYVWEAAILGFSRARRVVDGREGLLLIAERQEGLVEAQAALEEARRKLKAEAGKGGKNGQGEEGRAKGEGEKEALRAIKRRLPMGGGEGGGEGEGRGMKRQRRAERVPVRIEGRAFWYAEVSVGVLRVCVCVLPMLGMRWEGH